MTHSNTAAKAAFLFFFLFLSSFAAASYTQLGTNETNFQIATGIWTDVSTSTARLISSPTGAALVGNVLNDGEQRIFIKDGGDFSLFSSPSLGALDSYSYSTASAAGDGSPVLAVLNTSNASTHIVFFDSRAAYKTIRVVKYINGAFKEVLNATTAGMTAISSNGAVIACKNENCYLEIVGSNGGNNDVYLASFNLSGVTSEKTLHSGAAGNVYCLPSIPAATIIDYDANGQDDFIMSNMLAIETAADEQANVDIVSLYTNGTLNTLTTITDTTPANLIAAAADCVNVGDWITSPYVENIDGAASNGKEIVFAFQKDADEYKMVSYRASGAQLDDYPEIQDADGVLVSNIMQADADISVSTTGTSFCVAGYNSVAHQLEILCGSHNTGLAVQSLEFFYDSSAWNITASGMQQLTHSGEFFSDTQSSSFGTLNPSEFITPYGILTPNFTNGGLFTTCTSLGFCGLQLRDEMPAQRLAVTGADFGNGRADLVGLSSTSLYYIDDGYINLDCSAENCFSTYSINPCIDSGSLQQNTSVQIQIVPQDADDDLMQARATLYLGETAEQVSNWSINLSAGQGATFAFTANVTSAISTLRLEVRQGSVPANVDTIDRTFSVASTGKVLGQCVTSVDVAAVTEAAAAVGTSQGGNATRTDNAITSGLDSTGAIFGLPALVLYLLLMIVLGFLVLWKFHHIPAIALLVSVLESLLFILGAVIGVFPTGTLIAVIVLAIVFGVVALSRKATGGG